MSGLTILGAGGHGRVVADIAECSGYSKIEFVDLCYPARTKNLAWDIVGKDFNAASAAHLKFVAIGDNRQRIQVLEDLFAANVDVPILVHPNAVVSRYASIGAGTVIMPGAIINAGAKLGRGVIANTGRSIDHDSNIADGVHISPGVHVAGEVSIGRASWIGVGTSVRDRVTIGAGVTVGAGAAVVRDLPDGAFVVGVPAR